MPSPLRIALIAVLAMSMGLEAVEIGDPAPTLGEVTWIRDKAVAFEGKFTVIEFWSTTTSTDSVTHLTALQHEHRDAVQVVGLSSESPAVAAPFVDDLGGDMDYHVGLVSAATASTWLGTHDQLPSLFIVDRAGRLAWRGNVDELDGLLERLLAGSIDTARLAKLAPIQEQLDLVLDREHADQAADDQLALAITAKLLAVDPANTKAISTRLWLCSVLQQPDLAADTIAAVPVDHILASDASALALELLGEEDPAYRFSDFAYSLAKRARALAPGRATTRDTYARFLAQAGLFDAAITEQKAAIACEPQDDALVATLDYYQSLRSLRTRIEADLKDAPPPEPPRLKPEAAPAPAEAVITVP